MKKFKSFIANNQKFLLYLIFSILISSTFVVFLSDFSTSSKKNISYNNTNSKTIEVGSRVSEFDKLCEDINTLNDNLIFKKDSSDFDIKKIIFNLESTISKLNDIKSNLMLLIVTDEKIFNSYTSLVKSINCTIDIYTFFVSSLNTKQVNLDDLKKLSSQYKTSYEKSESLGLPLYYSDSMNLFLNNFTIYTKDVQRKIQDEKFKKSQANEFLHSINKIIFDFELLLKDMKPAIEQVREDGRSIDILINEILEKENSFKTLNENLKSFSIPFEYDVYYKSLVNLFDVYKTYLSSIKSSLIFEKSCSNFNENKKEILKNYNNSYSKFNDVLKSLESLKNSLKNSLNNI